MRLLFRIFGLSLIAAALVQCASRPERSVPLAGAGITWLPVRYAADRFFVAPITGDGDRLLFYTDTGGGTNMIYRRSVERLGLETTMLTLGEESYDVVSAPGFAQSAGIPLPADLPPFGDSFLVREAPTFTADADGFLGRTWFADRVWVFDYPKQSLGLVTVTEPLAAGNPHRVGLGFQADAAGNRTTHFPSIPIEVDGAPLDMLFDTGATVELTDTALAELDDGGPPARGTSFIIQTVFDGWRQRHPGWRVIEGADRLGGMPMIEVPEITIAGHTVGPVWFTMRGDSNFHEYMSQWMDRRVDGALGGSALRYFRVIVDYPEAVAIFDAD